MIRGILFDINGTIVDIRTDEGYDDTYRILANFLDYQGIQISQNEMKELYFEINKRQRRESSEQYPEFDIKELFSEILSRHGNDYSRNLSLEKQKLMPVILAELFRASSRFQLQLYPDVLHVLDELWGDYRMAALSDGQSVWAIPELRSVGLFDYFNPILVSSDLGYRKPDPRMFERVLQKMNLAPSEVIFVGNDMFRDVFGASQLGMKTVFFQSNQGDQRKSGAEPDYIIYNFSELPTAVRFLSSQ